MPPSLMTLFALDPETKEAIISSSKYGSTEIVAINRLTKEQDPELYEKVVVLDQTVQQNPLSDVEFDHAYHECLRVWRKRTKVAGKI